METGLWLRAAGWLGAVKSLLVIPQNKSYGPRDTEEKVAEKRIVHGEYRKPDKLQINKQFLPSSCLGSGVEELQCVQEVPNIYETIHAKNENGTVRQPSHC